MRNGNKSLSKNFQEIFEDIKNDVTKTQFEIMLNANVNLVKLYFRIGKTIYTEYKYDDEFVQQVAQIP